jgi:Electron transfer DM13
MPTSVRRHPQLVLAALIALVVLVAGLYWFQPWKLFTSSTVDEALPPATAAAPPQAGQQPAGTGAAGQFVSYEHETTGTARVVRLADGSQILRLENFATSDGPDLRVYLSRKAHTAGGGRLGQGFEGSAPEFVELGGLKATHGNQNYVIPAGVDLTAYRSAVIWCYRFSVAFGAAPVQS